MATIAVSSFAPAVSTLLGATSVSATIALSATGTPQVVRVKNLSPVTPAFIALNTDGSATSVTTGMAVGPQESVFLTLGANTSLAAITQGGSALLSVTTGS